MHLPDARTGKDSVRDKMSFYAQAMHDSARREEQLKNDPYRVSLETRAMEEKINTIREQVYVPQQVNEIPKRKFEEEPRRSLVAEVKPVQRSVDPDLAAINETIEKLAALQQPQGQGKAVKPENNDALEVRGGEAMDEGYFGAKRGKATNRFYDERLGEKKTAMMAAVIAEAQVLQAGSVVKIQTRQAITISNHTLPAGSLIYGIAAIDNERLLVQISTISTGQNLLPVDLSIYDLDGMEGIYAPGSTQRDILKSTADQSLHSVNVMSLDGGLKTQAASAGIGAAKNIISKKAKAIRVSVSAGYLVFLCDNRLKQN